MNYTLFDSKKIIFKLFLVELAFKPLVSRLSCKQLGQLFSHFYAVSQNTMKVITRLENVEEFLKNFLSDGKKVDACSFLCTEFGTNKKGKYKKRQRKPQFRAILKSLFYRKCLWVLIFWSVALIKRIQEKIIFKSEEVFKTQSNIYD